MASLIRKIVHKGFTFRQFSLYEKLWILLLYPLSGAIRAAMILMPFRYIAPLLGRYYQNIELSTIASTAQQQRAWRIGMVINVVSKYTLWESRCLVKATMASILLNYYNIPYCLYLGVFRETERVDASNRINFNISPPCLQAHAWVKVGQWVITGRHSHRKFTVAATYIAPSLTSLNGEHPS